MPRAATVGQSIPRRDGVDKVTGRSRYVDDLTLPGMLHGITVRSTVPRGGIRDIRFEPGVPWDEFVIVQPKQSQPEAARALAARIVSTLNAPFEIDGQTIRIGASVGVALFPIDARTADDLIKKADVALYQAKFSGRGGVSAFSRELERDIMRKKDFEKAKMIFIQNKQK